MPPLKMVKTALREFTRARGPSQGPAPFPLSAFQRASSLPFFSFSLLPLSFPFLPFLGGLDGYLLWTK